MYTTATARRVQPDAAPGCRINDVLGSSMFESRNPLAFVKRYVRESHELTLLYEQDLLDTRLLPFQVRALRKNMDRFGLDFLHPRRSKLRAMSERYHGRDNVPVRLVFFNSPVALRLERAGITDLGSLLNCSVRRLTNLTVSRHGPRTSPVWLLSRDDVFEVQIVLDEHALHLRGASRIYR